jgi:peptide/nickel transport system ATP-binding protein
VRYIADRVVVMYLGYIVEQGTTDQIFSPPYHPYTEALLSAIPIADTSVVKKHIVLEGDIPSAMNPPTGCPFQTRCRYKHLVADNLCETKVPPVKDLGDGHKSLCWLADDVLARMEPVISFDNGHDEAEPAGNLPGDLDDRPADEPAALDEPRRPRGKRAAPAAGKQAGKAIEREATARARSHERKDEAAEPGGKAKRASSKVAPAAPLKAGSGRQAQPAKGARAAPAKGKPTKGK